MHFGCQEHLFDSGPEFSNSRNLTVLCFLVGRRKAERSRGRLQHVSSIVVQPYQVAQVRRHPAAMAGRWSTDSAALGISRYGQDCFWPGWLLMHVTKGTCCCSSGQSSHTEVPMPDSEQYSGNIGNLTALRGCPRRCCACSANEPCQSCCSNSCKVWAIDTCGIWFYAGMSISHVQ